MIFHNKFIVIIVKNSYFQEISCFFNVFVKSSRNIVTKNRDEKSWRKIVTKNVNKKCYRWERVDEGGSGYLEIDEDERMKIFTKDELIKFNLWMDIFR